MSPEYNAFVYDEGAIAGAAVLTTGGVLPVQVLALVLAVLERHGEPRVLEKIIDHAQIEPVRCGKGPPGAPGLLPPQCRRQSKTRANPQLPDHCRDNSN